MQRRILVLAITLFIAACKPGEVDLTATDTMTVASSSHNSRAIAVSSAAAQSSKQTVLVSSAPKAAVAARGSYQLFTPGVVGNGQTSVLFFHASWCPICKVAEGELKEWYATEGFPLSVYQIDYDADENQEYVRRYGVTYQHTFVRIDGQGNAVKTILAPTDAQLKALLSSSL